MYQSTSISSDLRPTSVESMKCLNVIITQAFWGHRHFQATVPLKTIKWALHLVNAWISVQEQYSSNKTRHYYKKLSEFLRISVRKDTFPVAQLSPCYYSFWDNRHSKMSHSNACNLHVTYKYFVLNKDRQKQIMLSAKWCQHRMCFKCDHSNETG